MYVWRISDHHDLLGKGGLRASGRWHTRGSRIVYLADSSPGALLEVLVHLEVDGEDIPDSYALLKVYIPEDFEIQNLAPPGDEGWRTDVRRTREVGEAWLKAGETPLARVPSAIVSESWNYLLNPEHPLAHQAVIEAAIREQYDKRLFQFRLR